MSDDCNNLTSIDVINSIFFVVVNVAFGTTRTALQLVLDRTQLPRQEIILCRIATGLYCFGEIMAFDLEIPNIDHATVICSQLFSSIPPATGVSAFDDRMNNFAILLLFTLFSFHRRLHQRANIRLELRITVSNGQML
jgi:hypothetical protein